MKPRLTRAATPPASPARPARGGPTFAHERRHGTRSGLVICGVDEAGRGPWAGPVCAAAVILDPRRTPRGIDDSKALTAARREALEAEIKAEAVSFGVGFADVDEIFAHNILRATGLAMCRAVEALSPRPDVALVDGNHRFALPCEVKTLVSGDALSLSIAAASILAKTARDRLMTDMDALHPGYGFARHKGYHAPEHVQALRTLGPCAIHRRGWAPIRALIEQGDLFAAPPAASKAQAA